MRAPLAVQQSEPAARMSLLGRHRTLRPAACMGMGCIRASPSKPSLDPTSMQPAHMALAERTSSSVAGGVTAPSCWRPQRAWIQSSRRSLERRAGPRRTPIDGTPGSVVIRPVSGGGPGGLAPTRAAR